MLSRTDAAQKPAVLAWVSLGGRAVNMDLKIPVTNEILGRLAALDRLRDLWAAEPPIPQPRLARLIEAARVGSVAASSRLAGLRLTDADVSRVLGGDDEGVREVRLIRGYAAALDHRLPEAGALLTSEDIRRLHAVMVGAVADEPTPFREVELMREAFDAEGRATGRVFTTMPPHLIADKTETLLTWYEFELRSGERHPVLAIAALLLVILAISPFASGNGRLARILAGHLLRRAGYGYVDAASLEAEIEARRETTYDAFDEAQLRLWSGEADLAPWLAAFVEICTRHRQRVESRIDLERRLQSFPPLQQEILRAVREHGSVDAGLLLETTGTNRNTLKDNLRRLVSSGVLEKTGERRATRYRLA